MQRTHMDLQGTGAMSDVLKLENAWQRGSKLLQWRVWPADQPSPCGSRPFTRRRRSQYGRKKEKSSPG